jgi:hypothetical protein
VGAQDARAEPPLFGQHWVVDGGRRCGSCKSIRGFWHFIGVFWPAVYLVAFAAILIVRLRRALPALYEFPVSPEAEVVEKFTPTPDGTELHYEIRLTDPVMLTEAIRHQKTWFWRPEIQVQRYACEEEHELNESVLAASRSNIEHHHR